MPEFTREQLDSLMAKLGQAISSKRGANLSRQETMFISTLMVLTMEEVLTDG